MFTPENYRKFKKELKELDRVFDRVVKNSIEWDGVVYIQEKILSSYPRRYLDYYMATRNILIVALPDESATAKITPSEEDAEV